MVPSFQFQMAIGSMSGVGERWMERLLVAVVGM